MKITELIKKTVLCCLFILNTIMLSYGQYAEVVTPSQVPGATNEITTTFGDMINVSATDISFELQQGLQGYSATAGVVPPTPSILNYTGTILNLSWAPVSGAVQYEVRALNLETGQTTSQIYTPNSTNTYPFMVNTGLHMISIQSQNAVFEKSGSHVIIVEVDIVLMSDNDGDCQCEEYTLEGWYELDFETDENVVTDFVNALTVGRSFDLFLGNKTLIETLDNPYLHEDIITIHGQKTVSGTTITKNDGCNDNLADYGVVSRFDGSGIAVKEDLTISITPDVGLAIFAAKCKNPRDKPRNKGAKSTKVYLQNPIDNVLEIQNINENTYAIKVYNANGQQVAHQAVAYTTTASIPMHQAQAGLYFVELLSAQGTEIYKVIKTQ